MRKFLCLKDLVMKTDGRIELTAGKLYRETKPIGDRDNAVINNSGKTHNNVQRWGVFVETFERDGVEWILNQGEPIVPEGWLIDVMTGNGCIDESEECSHEWDWKTQHLDGTNDYCIYAIRIISTGEEEESGAGGGIEEAARRAPESITAVDTSLAPKFEPTATHTIPAAAVADIDYNPMMLGGKFGGGIER